MPLGPPASLMGDTDQTTAALALFYDYWRPGLVTVACCFAVGLVLRADRRMRTHPGIALAGAAALAVIYREYVFLVYLYGVTVFLYVRAVGRFAGPAARWPLAAAAMTAVAAGFLARAVADVAEGFGPLAVLDMYLALRLVVFAWEYGAGRFDRPGGVEFLAWFGLPFGLGNPIIRYSEFRPQRPWAAAPPPLGRGWWVAAAGRVGMLAGSAALFAAQDGIERSGWYDHWYAKLPVVFGTQPWGWYLGAAALAGLHRLAGAVGGVAVPVNYAAPYSGRSIADFWARWNITASTAFRDMLFYNRWGLARPNPYLNTMVVFLVIGVWHGATAYWVLFGLMHGAGVCAFLLWRRCRGRAARPLPWAVSWVVSYVYLCSCSAVPYQVLKAWRAVAPA